MILLIDIGNTRIKWVLTQHVDAISGAKTCYAVTPADLMQDWQGIEKPECVAISNVAGGERVDLIQRLASQLWPEITIIIARTQAHAHGVTNAYQQPEQLGVDRWLALLAINRLYKLPAIVVDCGTAITIDVLAEGGVHKGGLIVPGSLLMKQSLQQGTHSLEYTDTMAHTGLGQSTPSCISNGVLTTVVGLIEKVYQQSTCAEGIQPSLILTGGDAEQIVEHLTVSASVEVNAVLQGLALVIDD